MIKADGKGTCGGLKQAMELLPENERFMLIWSDLILPDGFDFPTGYRESDSDADVDYVGLSATFPCRWKYENGEFSEEKSTEYGVAGFFLFRDKRVLKDVPENGELVRWMQERRMSFATVSLAGPGNLGFWRSMKSWLRLRRDRSTASW